MTEPSASNGGTADSGETAAALARRGTAHFLPSFVALQEAVTAACASHGEWQAKIAAGVLAALEFAAEDPRAAHALTIEARRQSLGAGDREQELVGYFAAKIADIAPSERRFPVSTDAGVIESIAITVRGNLLAGSEAQLPALAPDLTYLALMPYAGAAEARRWAESGLIFVS